jgi:hypothetical protein
MFATATLVVYRGATLVSREDLAEYEPPNPKAVGSPSNTHSLLI